MNLFKLHDVSFSYTDGNTVFEKINLIINKNDLVIIKGGSGAGKSTFLKLFNRFCDSTGGDIHFHNRNLIEYDFERIRSSVMYLPQLPFVIDGTIEDNLSFPFSFHAHKKQTYDRVKAGEWIDYFQLKVPLDHDALKLSVGQKQRIALIRAMMLEPEVLLLDEPGSALDSTNRKLIEKKIASLIHSSKITVLMATHSEVSFAGIDHRVYLLEDRKLTGPLK